MKFKWQTILQHGGRTRRRRRLCAREPPTGLGQRLRGARTPGRLAQPVPKRRMNPNRRAGTSSSSPKNKIAKIVIINNNNKKGHGNWVPAVPAPQTSWEVRARAAPGSSQGRLRRLLTLLPLPTVLGEQETRKTGKKHGMDKKVHVQAELGQT